MSEFCDRQVCAVSVICHNLGCVLYLGSVTELTSWGEAV